MAIAEVLRIRLRGHEGKKRRLSCWPLGNRCPMFLVRWAGFARRRELLNGELRSSGKNDQLRERYR